MKTYVLILGLAAALVVTGWGKSGNAFAGRWDLTMNAPAGSYPDWLEVTETDGGLRARFQPRGGSVRPIEKAEMVGDHLILTIAAAAGKRSAMTWDLTVAGDKIEGDQKRGAEVMFRFTGMRAPALKRKAPKAWTEPEPIFNGKDLSGWEPDRPDANHWVANHGVLLNETKGANLRTTRKFDDFKLHIEFNCPDDGNSGVYLRGRYEVQIEYVPVGREDAFHGMGAVYGMVAPKVELPRKVGEWESFDITMVGRWVTIRRNGTLTIDNQEIAGITGGALDSHEGEPGPFYLQGDHTGGMMFRNITVALPRR